MTPRYFFHSFPRPHKRDTEADLRSRGLSILQEIPRTGIILAPEVIKWRLPLLDGTSRATELLQTRVCFTELSRHELPEHTRKFGPFSLEFDIASLRQLGALPVIYMPQTVHMDTHLSSLGSAVVTYLNDIRYTMRLLRDLDVFKDSNKIIQRVLDDGYKDAKTVADDLKITLQTGIDKEKQQHIISREDLVAVLSFLGFKNAPFEKMAGILSLVLSLFYPTDDDLHDDLLAYYRQREWRLVDGLHVNDQPHTPGLTEDEKQRLINIDRYFWERKIQVGNDSHRRVDFARTIKNLGQKPIIDFISKIWVPKETYDSAKIAFGDKVAVMDGM